MSKQTFDEQDWQELVLIDANGKETDWYCPLTVLELQDDGLLYVENDVHDYHISPEEYATYRVQNCTCSANQDDGVES